MGRTGTVLTFEKKSVAGVNFGEVKVDVGGGQTITAMCFFPPGVCDWPLPGDTAALVPGPRTGEWVAVGFIDPLLEPPVSKAGERVIYSRTLPGFIGTKIVLKTNGDTVWNDGKLTIKANGDIETDGAITAAGEVTGNGKDLSTHTHAYVDNIGDPPVPTPSETNPPS